MAPAVLIACNLSLPLPAAIQAEQHFLLFGKFNSFVLVSMHIYLDFLYFLFFTFCCLESLNNLNLM